MTPDEALEHVDAVVAAHGAKKPRTAAVVMETLAAEVRRLNISRPHKTCCICDRCETCAEYDAAVRCLLAIADQLTVPACSYIGRCNSGRCPRHSSQGISLAATAEQVSRVRSLRAKLGMG